MHNYKPRYNIFLQKNYLLDIKKDGSTSPNKAINTSSFNEPYIYKQKKSASLIKTIKFINNDTGKTRHFTPAAQEWLNSIYSYNKNYTKLLPNADKNVINLLKGYFNFFVNPKFLKNKTKRIANRYKKLSANRVFVGKGDLKHTNNKVIITKYLYNAERLYLRRLALNCARMLYYDNRKLKKDITIDRISNKEIITYNRPFTLKEYLSLPDHFKWHHNTSYALLWKQYIKLIGLKNLKNEEKKRKKANKKLKAKEKDNMQFIDKTKIIFSKAFSHDITKDVYTTNLHFKQDDISFIIREINNLLVAERKEHTILSEELIKNEKIKNFIEYIANINIANKEPGKNVFQEIFNTLNPLLELVENKEESEKKLLKFKLQVIINRFLYFSNFDYYINMAKEYYKKGFNKYIYLLMVNSAKFEIPFATKLIRFLENIYNKEVELNIVNLNKMHLNSDIYTQAVALKLKNRDNKLFRVLTSSLYKVKLPNISRIAEKYHKNNKNKYIINIIRNKYINSMFDTVKPRNYKEYNTKDSLNNLLLGFFSNIDNLRLDIKKRLYTVNRPVSLYKYIFATLKQIKLAGIRVEAKGRLTRRFTASRSVFKMRWKGGLKNVDSSFKGLSTVMLRGDRKSNVEYSRISSKNRNGAYAIKGWVSSK